LSAVAVDVILANQRTTGNVPSVPWFFPPGSSLGKNRKQTGRSLVFFAKMVALLQEIWECPVCPRISPVCPRISPRHRASLCLANCPTQAKRRLEATCRKILMLFARQWLAICAVSCANVSAATSEPNVTSLMYPSKIGAVSFSAVLFP